MAKFEELVKTILDFEGGYVDHSSDTGGATNFGISLRFMKNTGDLELFDLDDDGEITKNDVKLLTKDISIAAYKKYFWDNYKLYIYEPKLALLLFDMYVNHNPKSVGRMIQISLNRCENRVVVDGIVGPKTIAAILKTNSDELIQVLLCEREKFYRKIVQNNTSQEVFLNGWIDHRVDKLRRIILNIG